MTRIFPDYAYGDGPRDGCYWDGTASIPEVARFSGHVSADVTIIGGGFTGLNAAIQVAEAGVSVCVVDAQSPGWGASGRNGGFCCLGGGVAEDPFLDRTYGKTLRLEWRRAEALAVEQVGRFLQATRTEADVHSQGETLLAHRRRDARGFEHMAESIAENYGEAPVIHSEKDLQDQGMSAGFHGGITNPIGFALNPRKYLAGLVRTAESLGVLLRSHGQVTNMERVGSKWRLKSDRGSISSEIVIVATNGYSSEHIPEWLAARYMPVQSNVLVTRELTRSELEKQGWTSQQMCYDSRNLLHYFRLMPGNRFLFGMRGGLGASASSERRARSATVRNFRRMFPRWSDVEVEYCWSGMACVSKTRLPFVGPVPGAAGVWAALAYHGNGVAMGSLAGKIVGQLAVGHTPHAYPEVMKTPLSRFPLAGNRRILMPLIYGAKKVGDL